MFVVQVIDEKAKKMRDDINRKEHLEMSERQKEDTLKAIALIGKAGEVLVEKLTSIENDEDFAVKVFKRIDKDDNDKVTSRRTQMEYSTFRRVHGHGHVLIAQASTMMSLSLTPQITRDEWTAYVAKAGEDYAAQSKELEVAVAEGCGVQ